MKFLDLSNWNNIYNFDQIKDEGYGSVIYKATEGRSWTDKTFLTNVAKMKKADIKVGAYHFFRGGDNINYAIEQARHFYSTIKDVSLDIVPVLDIEVNEFTGQADRWANVFIEEFTSLYGKKPMIYTGWYYARDNFSLNTKINNYWWIASYGIKSLPPITGCKIVAWQYTETEKVNGIEGVADSNILLNYEDIFFNEEIEEELDIPFSSSYAENGQATVIVDKLNIRSNCSLSASVVATYDRGDKFSYDTVIHNEGYVWVEYTGYSGNRRFVAVKHLESGKRYADCK